MSNFQKVVEFNYTVDRLLEEANLPPVKEDMQIQLITEEYKEVEHALYFGSREELAKELADLLYVVYGMYVRINADADSVFDLVHQNNMSKFENGARFRDDGKLLKPDDYRPLTLEQVREVMD